MARSFVHTNPDYLYVDSAPATGYPFTMVAWMRPTRAALEAVLTLCDKDVGGAGGNYHNIYLSGGSKLVVADSYNGVTDGGATTSTAFDLDAWSHVGGVFASATDRAVFLNGGGKGTNATNVTPTGIDRLSVGRIQDASPTFAYSGDICEVAIWNVALTDEEMAALARGVSPLRIRPGHLVFYAPLYGVGDPEPDYTIGQAALTVSGATTSTGNPPVAPAWGFDETWPPLPAVGGAVTHFGATSLTLTGAVTTAGTRKTFSTTSLTETVARTTVGTRSTFGVVSRTETVGVTTVATRSTFASTTLTETVNVTTAGTTTGEHAGATSLTLTVGRVTVGKLGAYSAASLTETVTVTTAGTVYTPTLYTGATSLTLTVTITTAGAVPTLIYPVGTTGRIARIAVGRVAQPVAGQIARPSSGRILIEA